jgi:hypothetical protein
MNVIITLKLKIKNQGDFGGAKIPLIFKTKRFLSQNVRVGNRT